MANPERPGNDSSAGTDFSEMGAYAAMRDATSEGIEDRSDSNFGGLVLLGTYAAVAAWRIVAGFKQVQPGNRDSSQR